MCPVLIFAVIAIPLGVAGGQVRPSMPPVSKWPAFESGFAVDGDVLFHGQATARCVAADGRQRMGARIQIALNQKRPAPVVVTGWSRCSGVEGSPDGDYSIYIDAMYTDGTPLWGAISPFGNGTHGWQERRILIQPTKPLRSMTVHALFRNHPGTVWFGDFRARTLVGPSVFDGQVLDTPTSTKLARPVTSLDAGSGLQLFFDRTGGIGTSGQSSALGGLLLRDVNAGFGVHRCLGRVVRDSAGVTLNGVTQKIAWQARLEVKSGAVSVTGELKDLSGHERATTVYLAVPFYAPAMAWGEDIRRATLIDMKSECSNQFSINAGSAGGMSVYPFGSVSNGHSGLAVGVGMDTPALYRIFYCGPKRQLVIAWDLALTDKIAPAMRRRATFRAVLFGLPASEAKWGFRAAARRFYELNPARFARRARTEGIWMPFTAPFTVNRPQDFGFAYHEGDNSIADDHRLGILSFRYTEPMTYWMPMPLAMPRTYEQALGHLQDLATGADEGARNMARATINSGTMDTTGHYNLQFRNEPWANGAVFVLDPNPDLPATADQPTKSSLNLTPGNPDLDGEYLDSLEGWSEYLDYRPSDLANCTYPVPFDFQGRAALPQWYSTFAFADRLSRDLHHKGKLLMANSTPIHYSIFAGVLDVMGIETNWRSGTEWHPDDDATFALRRTLSFQRPYLLLQNTDFDKFSSDDVHRYFERSLAYGVFPSMFSVDAANNPYWQTPRWYERDRALFKKYIPVIKRLSAAGWQPVTNAWTSDPAVYVERFGTRLFTVLNNAAQPKVVTLKIQGHAVELFNCITSNQIPFEASSGRLTVRLSLAPEQALAIEMR